MQNCKNEETYKCKIIKRKNAEIAKCTNIKMYKC